MPTPNSVYDLFQQMRARPGMYLGVKSIERLDVYCRAYEHARIDAGKPLHDDPPFGHFFDFVAARYDDSPTKGWARIILENTANDPARSVEIFYKRLDEFRAFKPEIIGDYRLSPTQRAELRHRLPYPLAAKATRLQIIRYPVRRMPYYLLYMAHRSAMNYEKIHSAKDLRRFNLEFKRGLLPYHIPTQSRIVFRKPSR